MIPVTRPYLPSKNKYIDLVNKIYINHWLTNNGPMVQDYEKALKSYLKTDGLLYVNNGTIALQLAIKVLGLKGDIITTPFSYVATTSSIVWEGCNPVFVDIDQHTLNIDVNKIESAITNRTTAILATHCFGNACDIDAIEQIAQKNNLKVIYDAAHCFGTKYNGESIFKYGDISTCSLHATKLIHSVEGGLVSSNDMGIIKKLAFMRNFGHNGPENFNGVGINAKNSEFHAAMGLCVLDDVDQILSKRKEQAEVYETYLKKVNVQYIKIQEKCSFNYAYFPIILDDDGITLKVIKELEKHKIHPRRYFYPSLNQLDYVKSSFCPVSESISKRIICLPIYHDLTSGDQKKISKIINKTL